MIPADLVHNARMEDSTASQSGSEILQKLRLLFAEDPKGKGKTVESNHYIHENSQIRDTDNQSPRQQIGNTIYASPVLHPRDNAMQLTTMSPLKQQEKQDHRPLGEGMCSGNKDIHAQDKGGFAMP